MPVVLPIQTNFTSGELSPRLWAHIDIAKYKNGLKTATNCTIYPHGPVRRRNGFKFISEVDDSTKLNRLIRFQFDQDNAYILEFSENLIRFYKNGGLVLSGGLPYEVATTYSNSEIFDITYVQFGRLLYLFHGSHAPAILRWTSDASWELSSVVFYPPPTIEKGYSPGTTLTPAATSGAAVNFTTGAGFYQAADVGRQLQNLAGTGIAVITSVTSLTVAVCAILEAFPSTSAIASGDWKIDLSPIASLTPSIANQGAISTFTAAVTAFRNDQEIINKYIIINNGVAKIIDYTSATVIRGENQKALNALTASTVWSVEELIWSSTNGYPRTCALHQQRLWAGGSSLYPQKIWASEVGILDSMGVGSRDSDALDFDLSGKEVSRISWMTNIRGQLAVGTTSGEITVGSNVQSGPITPSDIDAQPRNNSGSNLQQPISLDDQVIYIQRSGKKINSFSYDFNIDNYKNDDLLFLAEHMPGEDGIKELAYAQDPDRNIYAVLNNGDMLVCTYLKEQEVIAWSRWTTQGSFESVNTISTGANDEVWVVVKRIINGTTKRYVERLDISTGEDSIDGFSDSYLTYSLPKTITSITKANPGVVTATAHGFSNGDLVKLIEVEGMVEVIGHTYKVANKTADTFELTTESGTNVNTTSFTTYVSGGEAHKLVTLLSSADHLEGETVQVKADGASHPDEVVVSGDVSLQQASYEATVGLSYETDIETLPQEYSLGSGSQQSQRVRRVRPVVRLYKSTIPLFGESFIPARTPQDLMDSKLDLFTGDIIYGSLTWNDGFSSSIHITTDKPFPLTLLGIFGSTEGGLQ